MSNRLWTELFEQGTGLQHLANMPAADVEQFAIKCGPLEHEVRTGKWNSVFAVLWRDPSVPIDEESDLGFLLYPDEQASAPIMVLQLGAGSISITPPKTKRTHSWCPAIWRLQVGKIKLILGSADAAEQKDWEDHFTLSSAVRSRLRTTVSRTELMAAEQLRVSAEASLLADLAARMKAVGAKGGLKVTTAPELSSAKPMHYGWVRREGRQNAFTRCFAVLWRSQSGDEDQRSTWLVFFEHADSTTPEKLYRLCSAAGDAGSAKPDDGSGWTISVSEPKKPRSNCPNSLRLDGTRKKSPGTFKLVMGADTEAECAQWRAALAGVCDGTAGV